MRNHPPNREIIPVLAAIIFRNFDEVFIARRKPHLSNGGKWEFPGGKLHPGESPEDCLQREIFEELGVEIRVNQPFHIVNHIYPDYSILLIGYHCDVLEETWQLKDHDETKWVKVASLHRFEFSEPDKEFVRKLQEVFVKR